MLSADLLLPTTRSLPSRRSESAAWREATARSALRDRHHPSFFSRRRLADFWLYIVRSILDLHWPMSQDAHSYAQLHWFGQAVALVLLGEAVFLVFNVRMISTAIVTERLADPSPIPRRLLRPSFCIRTRRACRLRRFWLALTLAQASCFTRSICAFAFPLFTTSCAHFTTACFLAGLTASAQHVRTPHCARRMRPPRRHFPPHGSPTSPLLPLRRITAPSKPLRSSSLTVTHLFALALLYN